MIRNLSSNYEEILALELRVEALEVDKVIDGEGFTETGETEYNGGVF